MDGQEQEREQGKYSDSAVNDVRIKNAEAIEQIINNILISKKELGITLYPSKGYFKSYLLEIKPKFLLIDSLMPFYGNKIISKSEFIKVGVGSGNNNIERYFLTKFKEEIINGEEINFLIFKPIEVVLIEKRIALRVSTSQSNMAFINFSHNGQNYFMPVYDLSWNGISFNSEFKIETGYVIKHALIKLSEKSINADLKIAHSTHLSGQYRVGCMIINISDNDRDKLINFILTIERQDINSNLGLD